MLLVLLLSSYCDDDDNDNGKRKAQKTQSSLLIQGKKCTFPLSYKTAIECVKCERTNSTLCQMRSIHYMCINCTVTHKQHHIPHTDRHNTIHIGVIAVNSMLMYGLEYASREFHCYRYGLCISLSVLSTFFYLMKFREGIVLRFCFGIFSFSLHR